MYKRQALGIDISRINIDLLGNVINVVIAIFVFVSGYCLIDRWNVKKVNNQKAIAESVLHSIYKNCLLYVEYLDQPQIVKTLIEQTDFDKRYHELNDPSPAFAGYLIRAVVNRTIAVPEYVYYYTNSSIYDTWKNSIFIQSTIQNIGADRYSNMPIIVPNNIEEQRSIVEYLNERCVGIDALIRKKQQYLTEIENYKKSLIYEYVTGKREV